MKEWVEIIDIIRSLTEEQLDRVIEELTRLEVEDKGGEQQ
jgi:hypothetical protein